MYKIKFSSAYKITLDLSHKAEKRLYMYKIKISI